MMTSLARQIEKDLSESLVMVVATMTRGVVITEG